MRAIAIVLAITGALALSGIAAPAPAQAGRLASTPYGCDPSGGPYLGTRDPTPIRRIITVTPRIAERSIYIYFGPGYYGYRYGGPRYFHHRHNGWRRHW